MDEDREGDSRNDLARNRTDFAEDRTLLAHERNFAGWLRTGMAAVGIGLAFNALFRSWEPAWVPKAIATAFLMAAGYIFLSAARRERRAVDRLSAHDISTLKPIRIRMLAWFLTFLSAALAVAIWLLTGG